VKFVPVCGVIERTTTARSPDIDLRLNRWREGESESHSTRQADRHDEKLAAPTSTALAPPRPRPPPAVPAIDASARRSRRSRQRMRCCRTRIRHRRWRTGCRRRRLSRLRTGPLLWMMCTTDRSVRRCSSRSQ